MAQTSILTSITKTGVYPISTNLSADNNCGTMSINLVGDWTDQMIHELPTINFSVYMTDGTKLLSVDFDMETFSTDSGYVDITKPYTISLYNLPSSFVLKTNPVFDKYALQSHNEQVDSGDVSIFNTSESGIVDSNITDYSSQLWTIPTQTFNLTVTFDDSNIKAGGGGGHHQDITVDTQMSGTSTNPVENKAIYNFVNNSVATNTAFFIGTFNSVAELEAYSGDISNNDYAFVISTDSAGNTIYNRYKYNGDTSEWLFEYSLNNSSFTAEQWATIQSGITANDKTNWNNHLIDTNNPHSVTKSQVGLSNVDNTSDLDKPISTATQNALNNKQDTLSAGDGITISSNEVSISDITGLDASVENTVYSIQFNTKGQITEANKVTSLTLNCVSTGLDGTPETYLATMKKFFAKYNAESLGPAQLTDLCAQWYAFTRDNWNGWTTFENTGVSTGTKGGDNAGLVCEPSTNTVAGTDDYAGLPLFYPIDVNFVIDANTKDIMITGIDGITSSFERYNPDKFVGVMQMSGYVWESEDSLNDTYTYGYSSQYYSEADNCFPIPESVRLNGSMRQFIVHTKYMGKIVDGSTRSYSGVIPSAYVYSHNTTNTYGAANGSQYSGGSVLVQSFLHLMTFIKYASLTQDGIIQGCVNYNYQYAAQIGETGVKRILITTDQASNLVVGSSVLVGTVATNNRTDRNSTSVYNISGQSGCLITAIENIEVNNTTYAAVYVNTTNTFDTVGNGTTTTGNTLISTFAWATGSNDNILGNDGSLASPSSGKYPAKIQGIEYSVGTFEVFGDIILRINSATEEYPLGYYSYHVCKNANNRSTSITSNYEQLDYVLPYVTNTSGNWRYITRIKFNNGIATPVNCSGGSSSTYTKDAFYFDSLFANATREWPSFGCLVTGGADGGLSYISGDGELSDAYWFIGSRLSCSEAFRV